MKSAQRDSRSHRVSYFVPTVGTQFEIAVPPFNFTAGFALGGSRADLTKLFRRHEVPSGTIERWCTYAELMLPRAACMCLDPDAPWFACVIVKPDVRRGIETFQNTMSDLHGAISHELLHLVAGQLRQKRIEFTQPTEEVFAYLMEYLTTSFWRRLQAITPSGDSRARRARFPRPREGRRS
jgi:hypothetical protein